MKFQDFLRGYVLIFGMVPQILFLGTICSASDYFWRLDGDQNGFDPSEVLTTESRPACAIRCNISPGNCTNFLWVSSNKTCYLTLVGNNYQPALPSGEGRIYKRTRMVCPETLPSHAVEMEWEELGINHLRGRIVRCEEEYTPSSDQPEVICLNDVWSGATCNRKIFHNPATQTVYHLPRPMEIGWTACIRAYPTINKRFSFLLRENSGVAITGGYFDYRYDHDLRINATIFNTLHNGVFVGMEVSLENISPFPFFAGRDFDMNFTVLGTTELINTATSDGVSLVRHYTTYSRDLLDVIGFYYNHDVTITYLNLWCHE